MILFLSKDSAIKYLETPSVYHILDDELYELDEESFSFLQKCASENGCQSDNNEFVDYCLAEDILTESPGSLKRPPLKKSPVPSLRYLELQITDKCNLTCRHCYVGVTNNRELTFTQVRRALKEVEEMQGLRVLITGGEPLMHSKFDEINEILPEFFLRKILFTNGLLLSNEVLSRLNVHEIQISIDGLQDSHDLIRGKGTFRTAINAIKQSIDKGFEVSVSTMIHSKNLSDFDQLEILLKELGIKEWAVDVPCASGRLEDNPLFQVTPEQGGKYLAYGYGEGLHSGAKGFGCGLHLMAVMPDGTAGKCTFYGSTPAGTIAEGLLRCWKRIQPVKLDELKCDCTYIDACRGGCRFRAELLGDPLGKDLFRCALYQIKLQQ
jgi:radical SAM protein with 4Fe4S-binding SPASM domain